VKHDAIKHAKSMERAIVAAAAGDIRAINFVRNGGNRAYPSIEASLEAKRQASTEHNRRVSAADLAFRLEHATGCSHPGCPLAADVDVLRLLQHDHTGEVPKTGNITDLHSEERIVELAKTRCLCLWHHYLHTREDRGDRNAGDAISVSWRVLNQLKLKTGCQHPLHHTMPHAALVPSGINDPLVFTFLDVAHFLRGGEHCTLLGSARCASHLRDLSEGRALVFCSFCHAMYTVCEMGKLNPEVPFSQYQFTRLKERRPDFVALFEETTRAWGIQEWAAERLRLNGLSKKRKREDDDDDHRNK